MFTLRMRGRRVVRVTVQVDTAPDAYAVLERTVDEAVQIWPVRFQSPPQHIDRLGIDADWFPEEQHLMTTDAVRLITATVAWPPGEAGPEGCAGGGRRPPVPRSAGVEVGPGAGPVTSASYPLPPMSAFHDA